MGPKKADCTPIKNNITISSGTLLSINAAAASTMMPISASLMRFIKKDFSYLSATCPPMAENRKNGRIKTPAATLINNALLSVAPASRTAINATSAIRAFLKTLSLKAPRNWVMKKGRKRCWRNS